MLKLSASAWKLRLLHLSFGELEMSVNASVLMSSSTSCKAFTRVHNKDRWDDARVRSVHTIHTHQHTHALIWRNTADSWQNMDRLGVQTVLQQEKKKKKLTWTDTLFTLHTHTLSKLRLHGRGQWLVHRKERRHILCIFCKVTCLGLKEDTEF